MNSTVPVIGFIAYSGTGKTTLLEKLIPELKLRGVRVAMIKHAHHHFDIDKEGKDSYRLRKAGADQMLIASDNRWALMTETPHSSFSLDTLIKKIDTQLTDLILVEGFKHEAYDKIELHRDSYSHEWIYPHSNHIVAVASDKPTSIETLPNHICSLNINDTPQIADFIMSHTGLA